MSAFFDNLSTVLERYKFGPEAIYNMQRPNRVVAKKGVKQVGAVVSQERGQLVILEVVMHWRIVFHLHLCFREFTTKIILLKVDQRGVLVNRSFVSW